MTLRSGDLAVFSPELLGNLPRSAKTQYVALLDRDGVVVGVNRAWRRFALANGSSVTAGIGTNYLLLCEQGESRGEPRAAYAVRLIRAALNGVEGVVRHSYPCGDPSDSGGDAMRWFSMRAIPLPGRHRGAIVVHMDVTWDSQHSEPERPGR